MALTLQGLTLDDFISRATPTFQYWLSENLRTGGAKGQFDWINAVYNRVEDIGISIAEWGDIKRVDMTFSAVKSYLSTIMALALRDGLVDDLHK